MLTQNDIKRMIDDWETVGNRRSTVRATFGARQQITWRCATQDRRLPIVECRGTNQVKGH